MTPYHICSEECFCQVLTSNLLEQLEVERPYEEEHPHNLELEQESIFQADPDLTSRMDEWWDELEELGGEG